MIKTVNDVKLFFKIVAIVFCASVIVLVGYIFYYRTTGPNPFRKESVPEDVITLLEAIPYANEYLKRVQGVSDLQIIWIDMEISAENGRGNIDLTYEYELTRTERCRVSIDTENHIINGGGGNDRIRASTLNICDWVIDSDEIVEIAEGTIREKAGGFDYSYISISSMIGASSAPMNSQLSIRFLDDNGFADDSNIYVNAVTGDVEVL